MEATNVIEARAKDSVDKLKSVADATCGRVDAAKKTVDEKRKREVAEGVANLNGEGIALETKSADLKGLQTASESLRSDLHQSSRLKAELGEKVVDLATTRDLE